METNPQCIGRQSGRLNGLAGWSRKEIEPCVSYTIFFGAGRVQFTKSKIRELLST